MNDFGRLGREHPAKRAILRILQGIREWCGDAAYDRYLESHRRKNPQSEAMTREAFYVSQLQKKYSRVSRCC
jgi:uncharacterized short protein YbdD (DUF466 family)